MACQHTTEPADIVYVPLKGDSIDESVVELLAALISRLLARPTAESDLPVIA